MNGTSKRVLRAMKETIYDSYSLDELDNCIQARLSWMREIDSFKADRSSNKYEYVLHTMMFHKDKLRRQIQEIIVIKCLLKKSGYTNMGILKNVLLDKEIPIDKWIDFIFAKKK